MPWELLLWLLAFMLQSGLLGVAVFQLTQLTDLEADEINPHDAAAAFNRVAFPEVGLQAALAALLLLSPHGVAFGLAQLAALGYAAQQWRRGRLLVDVTEIFREVKARRKEVTAKFAGNLLLFVLVVYRLVAVVVGSLLTPTGRDAARAVLKDAAAALHR